MVSVPHYGVSPLPDTRISDYADPGYHSFPRGYTDRFAAEIYGELDRLGATMLATPYSRLFVDVNRRRDDFELGSNGVESRKGVVRTHNIYDQPIFAQPLTVADVNERLRCFYDPYHAAMRGLIDELCVAHTNITLIDAHTGSERGLKDHEVVVSTAHGRSASDQIADRIQAVFAEGGFRTDRDVKGYSGGYIVRHYGREHDERVDAVQIEINTALLLMVSRRELFEQIDAGIALTMNESVGRRLKHCMETIVCDY